MTRSEALKIVLGDVQGRMSICDLDGCGRCDELRQALAILSQPETRPEGVPEFVRIGVTETGRTYLDAREPYRYRFDSIVPEKDR